jgi:hypothetical protein
MAASHVPAVSGSKGFPGGRAEQVAVLAQRYDQNGAKTTEVNGSAMQRVAGFVRIDCRKILEMDKRFATSQALSPRG